MSIEYLGTPLPPLDQPTIDDLLDRLTHSGFGRLMRRSESELGLASGNEDEMTTETTTIGLSRNKVYIAFHAATGDEMRRLLVHAQQVFRGLGIKCELEEE